MEHWHSLSLEEVFEKLGTSYEGLSEAEAKLRLKKYGYNELRETKKVSPLEIFINQFKNVLILTLILAAIASFFMHETIDAALILAIVLLNGIFGFIQDYKAEKAIEALKKLSSPRIRVIRDGKEKEIPSKELVPGDIVILAEGDSVPADIYLIDASNLKVDESALTGESIGVSKKPGKLEKDVELHERKNMLFKGTNVVRGFCKGVVVSTGMNTEIGKIAKYLEETEETMTPFQLELDRIGKKIGFIVTLICILVFLVILISRLWEHKNLDDPDIILIPISLAVAAIPEGLPIVVTLALALGAKNMLKRMALIRRLPVAEALGAVDVICTDKTGTLTENRMTVRKIFVDNTLIEVSGTGYETRGNFSKESKNLELLLKCGVLCNNASYQEEGKKFKFFGDPTEIALLVSGLKKGIRKDLLEKEWKKIAEISFSSERKRMTTIHSRGNEVIAFTKGAPEVVVELCSKIRIGDKIIDLDEEMKRKIIKVTNQFGSEALRVLAFACRPLGSRIPTEDETQLEKLVEKDMIFLGLQGMIDPPRKEVKKAIEDCHKAGIRVIMITGDNKLTAQAIAREIGIDGEEAIEGKDIERLSEEELRKLVERINIFARVSPIHKFNILKALRDNGHIVAMTGDGVNDAPALKEADVGISMGIRGTEVAKQASDIILLDDNFATIRNAVEEGRRIDENIKKFVNYLLSCNIAEVLIVFFASLPLLGRSFKALTPVQLLWINLLTDGPPALALGVDPAAEDILERKPRKKDEGIIDNKMLRDTAFTGFVIAVLILTLFFLENPGKNLIRAQTLAFTSLVVFEFARIYVIRSREKLSFFSNKYLILAVLLSLLMQFILLYSPLAEFFKVVPLTIADWIKMLILLVVFILIMEIYNRSLKRI
ncbi:MAG TPA: calcium-translocating P-type ATPase, SERCA-type [Candidatus Altiarchaeales archaeon]|nr:calcium-translocating P-type ATPase, SERCA-type [Candidatus Altiarchaeales archaeon]